MNRHICRMYAFLIHLVLDVFDLEITLLQNILTILALSFWKFMQAFKKMLKAETVLVFNSTKKFVSRLWKKKKKKKKMSYLVAFALLVFWPSMLMTIPLYLFLSCPLIGLVLATCDDDLVTFGVPYNPVTSKMSKTKHWVSYSSRYEGRAITLKGGTGMSNGQDTLFTPLPPFFRSH